MAVTVNAFTGTGNTRAKNPDFNVGRGADGQLLIAEATNYNDLTFTTSDLYNEQPLFVDSTIKEVADPLEQDFMDKTSASNPTELGISRVEGDTTVLTSCEGTAIFHAGITQQRLGGGTAIGTAGSTTVFSTGAVGSTTGDITLSGLNPIPNTGNEPARQLTVSFTQSTLTAANFHGDTKVAIVDITGTDAHGNTNVRDQIAVYRGDIPSPAIYKTRKFFRGPVTIRVRGFTAAVTATITAVNAAQTVVFTPQDAELVRFYGLEIDKPVPNFYYGMSMNSYEVSVSGTAVSSASIGWQGMRLNSYRNLLNATPTAPNSVASTATSLAGIGTVNFAEDYVYPGWSAELTVNGYTVPLIDATFSVNQNLTPSNVIAGVQHQAFPPYGAEKRDVMISGNILYSNSVDYNEVWKDRDYNSVILAFKFERRGMFDYETCYILPDAQMESTPDPDVADRGEATMPVSFKAKRRAPLDAEYNIEARYGNYQPVRNY